MKNANRKINSLGNQVAFLFGVVLNTVMGISQKGISDDERYLLIDGAIGGVVWLLCSLLYRWIKVRWFHS